MVKVSHIICSKAVLSAHFKDSRGPHYSGPPHYIPPGKNNSEQNLKLSDNEFLIYVQFLGSW